MCTYSEDVAAHLSDSEYAALSDQKAADWRSISQVNPALFGVAGALFAAGVAQREPAVVALSPLPLYLGVWHMVRHARLQLQMITYLHVFAPPGVSWERDVAIVRPRYWAQVRAANERRAIQKWLSDLARPSAWNTWLVISLALTAVACFIPLAACYPSRGLVVPMGLFDLAVASLVYWQARKVEADRERWTMLWREYQRETSGAHSS